MRPRPVVVAAALLAAGLTAAVAWPSLRYGFVYDDEAVVVERKPFWDFELSTYLASRPNGTGRHVGAAILDLDRLPAGTVPLPFHAMNIATAALLSVVFLAFALRLGMSPVAAGAAAALFAVHPVHVDSVAWVTGRFELLAALGVLGAMLLAVRPSEAAEDRRPLRVAAGCFLLGVLAIHSKENALCLPLLVVLARVFLGPRVALLPALLGTGLAVASWAVMIGPRLSTFPKPEMVDNPLYYAPFLERLPKSLDILWRYAGLLVWPHPLKPDRSFAETNPGIVEGWFAAGAWLVAAAATWRLSRRSPLAAFAIAWFPASFAVTGNVASPIGLLMAERLLLLPSVSACLLAGAGIDAALSARASWRGPVLVAAAGTVVVFFALFRHREAVWRDSDVYFAAQVEAAPLSAKAWYDQGAWLLRKGRRLEAEAALERATTIVPNLAHGVSLRAESMARRGDPGAGADVYLQYLQVRPDDTGAMTDAVRLLMDAGRGREALAWARRLVAAKPGDMEAVETLVLAEQAARLQDEREKKAGAAPAAPGVSP